MRQNLKATLAVLLAVMLLAACGQVNAQQSAEGRHLTIVTPTLPISMDPSGANEPASSMVNRHLYSTLVRLDYETFEPYPNLAVSWDMPDASTVNMQLRQGVLFHNGERLTARDVQFSLERGAVSPPTRIILDVISHVEVHDDYNFTVHLRTPFAPIMRHLGHAVAGIVHANTVKAAGDDYASHPIGTGPFMFSELHIGNRLELVRFDDFWGDLPQISGITFRLVPDASGRLMEIEVGTADIANMIAAPDVAVAEASPNVNLMRRLNLTTTYIGFNTKRAPFDNPLVRQAIHYALDTELIVDTVFFGVGQPARGPIADNVWGFHEPEPFPTNIDRARELLAQAGHADGFNTEFWWNIPDQQRSDVAEIVHNILRDLNINVSIVSMELSVYMERTNAGEHPGMFIMGWGTITGDADYGLFPCFHTSAHGAPGNRTFYSNPQLDALLEAGRSELDDAARMEIYRQALEIIRNDSPWIPLHRGEWVLAVSPDIRGLDLHPGGHHVFSNIYFDN